MTLRSQLPLALTTIAVLTCHVHANPPLQGTVRRFASPDVPDPVYRAGLAEAERYAASAPAEIRAFLAPRIARWRVACDEYIVARDARRPDAEQLHEDCRARTAAYNEGVALVRTWLAERAEAAQLAQDAERQRWLDAARGAADNFTFDTSRWAREQLHGDRGRVVDGSAYEAGRWAETGAELAAGLGAKRVGAAALERAFGHHWAANAHRAAKTGTMTRAQAIALRENAPLVWDLNAFARGDLIEAALARTTYANHAWVGTLFGGTFELVDILDNVNDAYISIKSVAREDVRSGITAMKNHLIDLGHAPFELDGRPAAKALDLRVPPGAEPFFHELRAFGRAHGVWVEISPF